MNQNLSTMSNSQVVTSFHNSIKQTDRIQYSQFTKHQIRQAKKEIGANYFSRLSMSYKITQIPSHRIKLMNMTTNF